MIPIETYLTAIRSQYPELEIHSAEPDTIGQFNHVLLVNDALIFRFPRYPQGIAVLMREAAILDAVFPHLPLPVPQFEYRSLQQGVEQAFVGYRRIRGELLWQERLRAVQQNEKTVRRLAFQLAGFLDALHHIPPREVHFDLPLTGGRTDWENMYREIRDLLFPAMRPDARQEVQAHFEAYLDDPALQAFEPCLIHGDFGPSNVLYDDRSHLVSGVIDFGFAGLGDPAQDIAAASCFGNAFLAQYAGSYPNLGALLPRARFIKGTFALSEALHGAKSGDEAAYRSGMEQYV